MVKTAINIKSISIKSIVDWSEIDSFVSMLNDSPEARWIPVNGYNRSKIAPFENGVYNTEYPLVASNVQCECGKWHQSVLYEDSSGQYDYCPHCNSDMEL